MKKFAVILISIFCVMSLMLTGALAADAVKVGIVLLLTGRDLCKGFVLSSGTEPHAMEKSVSGTLIKR